MAIPDLPVWTISPNWKTPITETLEWLTDVLQASNGDEQRRALRLSPRRSFEMLFNPVGPERTFLDLSLHRQGSQRWMLPLFHDKGKLTATADAGQDRIDFDTTYREFVAGGFAILLGRLAFNYEVVEIVSIDDDGINLTVDLEKTWQKGMTILPLRKAWLEEQSKLDALTSRVGESTMRFVLDGANDYPSDADFLLDFEGRHVVLVEPNRDKSLEVTYDRMSFTYDSQTGVMVRADDANRAFTSQTQTWLARGREGHHELRKLFYALQGQFKSVWLPSFNDDIVLARPAMNGAVTIDIKKIGYEYTGEVTSGRELILLDGHVYRITGAVVPVSVEEERLTLSAAIVGNQPVGRCGSFLDAARLGNDTIEITHHTDSDGTCEASGAWRTFKDTRNPAGAIYLPIPASMKGSEPCGTPGPASPCTPIFSGPFLTVVTTCDRGPNDPSARPGGWLYHTPTVQPYPPQGGYVAGLNILFGVARERGEPNNPFPSQPNLRGQLLVRQTPSGGTQKWEFFYPFPGEIFGEFIFFDLRLQYPAFSFGGNPDTLNFSYQWFDMPEPSPRFPLGWIGGLWLVNYGISIPNHTQDYTYPEG